jgi:hypothetical protein
MSGRDYMRLMVSKAELDQLKESSDLTNDYPVVSTLYEESRENGSVIESPNVDLNDDKQLVEMARKSPRDR